MVPSSITLVAAIFFSVTAAELNKKFVVFERCAKENDVPQKALEDFFNMVTAEGIKDHKCFFKCLFVGFGVLKDDGTIDEEKLHRGMKVNWSNPKDQRKILPVGDTCTKEVQFLPDTCEYLYSWIDCFMKGTEKVKAETKFITYEMRQ